jgi:predicted P-loop ATPase
MLDRFDFDLSERHTRDAVMALADKNRFNPVCDLIDEAEGKWDSVKRLDRAAADYFNCEDTQLNSACMRKALIAMVKRARHPGCKFDTIVVLESEEGFNKSSAWQALAGDENFSDERIIGAAGREVQEQLSGIWVHENADLAGMKKTDVESVKAYASRSIDRARPAYGRFLKKQPRHSIEVGTTNDSEYLQSQTGNRRFWPMVVMKSIDVEKLRRDRLQLIGEAAYYESKGESVVLHEDLWGAAGIQQEQRRVTDPWEDALRMIHKQTLQRVLSNGDWIEKPVDILHYSFFGTDEIETVSVPALLEHVLNVPISQQRSDHTMRLSRTMKRLGWQRNTNGYVSINGKRVRGYFRKRRQLSEVSRDLDPQRPPAAVGPLGS